MIEVIRILRYTFDSREGYDAHRRNWTTTYHSGGLGMHLETLSVTTAEHPDDDVVVDMQVAQLERQPSGEQPPQPRWKTP